MSEDDEARVSVDDDWWERALSSPDEDSTTDDDSIPDDASGGTDPAPDGEEAGDDGADPDEAGAVSDAATDPAVEPDGPQPEDGAVDAVASPAGAGGSTVGDLFDGDTDEDLFGEDFATAFQNAPSPDGASGEVLLSDTTFDDEDFDSAIPRIDIGIEGLDEMIQGGIPERSLIVAIGDAGTGKTTFGLEFIRHGLEMGENAVFIALEEDYDAVVSTADDKGWDFSSAVDEGQLAVLDLDPIEMANSLTSVRNELPDLVREFDASRLVLDSVSLLEMMYDSQATRRTQIYDFTQSLKRAGVTTMLTSEAASEDPTHSRFGIIEYLTDAVFLLRYIRPDDFRETRLAIEIQKIRDANHSREMKPYEITGAGINVYRQANIF